MGSTIAKRSKRFSSIPMPASTRSVSKDRTGEISASQSDQLMKEKAQPKYGRILLKLSGEAIGGPTGMGISPEAIQDMAQQIREVRELGVQVVVVVGGGNIFRGLPGSERGIERARQRLATSERTLIRHFTITRPTPQLEAEASTAQRRSRAPQHPRRIRPSRPTRILLPFRRSMVRWPLPSNLCLALLDRLDNSGVG